MARHGGHFAAGNGGDQDEEKVAASKTANREKQVHPGGWNEKRVGEVIGYFDTQMEDEKLGEYEAGMQLEGLRVMLVPIELVLKVNRLIKQWRGP